MGIFTTREIVLFIYGILLLAYIFVRRKGTDILLPVIKAACHIKLIIPFGLVLLFAAGFVWVCTYLPFWDWIYIKDIVFWVLFVGIPICFNATSRQLEENYFRSILIENLKFTALVEFITGTFTFSIIGELILQPLLVFFIILQSSIVKKTEPIKKVVDGLVGFAGFVIFGLTIKSMADLIGEIYFIDVLVGLTLPMILSIIYLPVAYFFALYAKYELVFLRMGFKEPDDKKLKINHRIKVLLLCKFSYKKVCKFLYEYLPKMYIRMSGSEFENMIDEFRGTTEHTYTAVIRYNGKYYINRNSTDDFFAFREYTINKGGLFNSRNKSLRKEIALQIQENTPFKNTDFNDSNLHFSVSLKKMFLFKKGALLKRTKVALFISNSFERRSESVDLPFFGGIKEQSNSDTIALMRVMKLETYWPTFITVSLCFSIFISSLFIHTDIKINLDLAAIVFTILCEFQVFFDKRNPMLKLKIGRRIIYLYKDVIFNGIQEILVFYISLLISYILRHININSEWMSKFSIALLLLCILIDIWKKDQ